MIVQQRALPVHSADRLARGVPRTSARRVAPLLWAGLLALGVFLGARLPAWLHLEGDGPIAGLAPVPWIEPPFGGRWPVTVSDGQWAEYLRPHHDFMDPTVRSGISPAMFVFSDASRHESFARDLLQDGHSYAEARGELNQCLALDPNRADCHKLLGVVHVVEGTPVTAKYDYEEYLRLAPDGPDAPAVTHFLEALARGDRQAAVPWGVRIPEPAPRQR